MGATTEVTNAQRSLIMRILIRRFLYRHPRFWAGAYLTAGGSHVFLGVVLTADGYRWAPGLIAVGALELWVAYQLSGTLIDSQRR